MEEDGVAKYHKKRKTQWHGEKNEKEEVAKTAQAERLLEVRGATNPHASTSSWTDISTVARCVGKIDPTR